MKQSFSLFSAIADGPIGNEPDNVTVLNCFGGMSFGSIWFSFSTYLLQMGKSFPRVALVARYYIFSSKTEVLGLFIIASNKYLAVVRDGALRERLPKGRTSMQWIGMRGTWLTSTKKRMWSLRTRNSLFFSSTEKNLFESCPCGTYCASHLQCIMYNNFRYLL